MESVLSTLMMRRTDVTVGRQRQSRLGEDTIETRIVPKVIPHGIQFQIAVVYDPKRHLHQFAQFVESSVAVSRHNEHCREIHLAHGTLHCISACRQDFGGATRMAE